MRSLTIKELLVRPIIRDDFLDEWMNKMTDEELKIWDDEVYAECIKSGVPEKFPELNAAHLTKVIDTGILYKIFQEDMKKVGFLGKCIK